MRRFNILVISLFVHLEESLIIIFVGPNSVVKVVVPKSRAMDILVQESY